MLLDIVSLCFFFFKQKTAYEMRTSDWSSDVCSSDLAWRLVSASDYDAEHAQNMAEAYSFDQVRSKAFYPLTFPMICGPGALSAALTVGATLHDDRDWATAVKMAGSLPPIAVAALVVYL